MALEILVKDLCQSKKVLNFVLIISDFKLNQRLERGNSQVKCQPNNVQKNFIQHYLANNFTLKEIKFLKKVTRRLRFLNFPVSNNLSKVSNKNSKLKTEVDEFQIDLSFAPAVVMTFIALGNEIWLPQIHHQKFVARAFSLIAHIQS